MGDISMWMVIETTRENEISPRESKYIEKRGAFQQNCKDERSKLKKTNPQMKWEVRTRNRRKNRVTPSASV